MYEAYYENDIESKIQVGCVHVMQPRKHLLHSSGQFVHLITHIFKAFASPCVGTVCVAFSVEF